MRDRSGGAHKLHRPAVPCGWRAGILARRGAEEGGSKRSRSVGRGRLAPPGRGERGAGAAPGKSPSARPGWRKLLSAGHASAKGEGALFLPDSAQPCALRRLRAGEEGRAEQSRAVRGAGPLRAAGEACGTPLPPQPGPPAGGERGQPRPRSAPLRPAGARGGGPGARPEAAVAGAVIRRAGRSRPVRSRSALPAGAEPRNCGESQRQRRRSAALRCSGVAPRGSARSPPPPSSPAFRRQPRGSRAEGRAGAAPLRGGSPD